MPLFGLLRNRLHVPPEFVPEFNAELSKIDRQSARILATLAAILVPASVVLDWYIYPSHVKLFLSIRLAVAAASLILLRLSFLDRGRLWYKTLSMSAMLVVGAGIASMIRVLGFDSGYYAGLNLIYLGSMVVPWGALNTAVVCFLVYSMYLLPILLFDRSHLDISLFVNNNVFQLETIIIAITVNYFLSHRKWFEILNRLTINKQARELQARDAYKREFIANVTHELKTPLSIVIGNADLILDSGAALDVETLREIQQIQQSAFALATHVDRIISVSISEDTEVHVSLDSYDYTGIARHIYSLFESQAVARSIAYGFVAPERHLIIHADMILIEEVLRNLVQNAFKFTPDNGTITITIGSDGEKVFTEISDTGAGIAPEKIEHIFERMYQADNVLSKRHGGLGLGLFIVKRNVELHGGAITVHSVVEKGTTFRFELPLHVDQSVQVKNLPWEGENRRTSSDRRSLDRRAAARAFEYRQSMGLEWLAEMSSTANLADFQNLRPDRATVLVAEDNPGMMKVLVEALRPEYNLLLAFNGLEALAKLGDHGTSVSLILTDIMMPELNGYDFCAKVMEHDEWKHIPLIFISALMSDEDKLKGYRLGATDYLVKPYNVKILQEKVAHWISRRNYEQLLKTMSETLEQRAQQLERVRDIIIHEIRNPLTIINGANFFMNSVVQAAADPSQQKDMRTYVGMLRDGIAALEGVLDCTRELDMQNLGEAAAVPIQEIIADAAAHTQHFFSGIKLTVATTEAQEHVFLCNRQMIVQVFVNLIRNAVDAIREKDSGEVGLVCISAAPLDHGKIQISIRDNGIGMSEEITRNLFQFKYTTKKNGTGIGLHLSKMMLKLHDASITVESHSGQGSVFHVYLPVVSQTPEMHLGVGQERAIGV